MLGDRLQNLINRSWQMYPVELLFGLDFDTGSEIGLIAIAAGVASRAVPALAVTWLAIMFASGMSLMDTAEGVFMVRAYSRAFSNPLRKIYCDIAATSLSVAIELLMARSSYLRFSQGELHLHGRFVDKLAALDFGSLGYGIVALFVIGWALSVLIWKFWRIEERWVRRGDLGFPSRSVPSALYKLEVMNPPATT